MDLKQFHELFNPLPGNHYLQVTDVIDETTEAIYELIEGANGELRVALYEDSPSNLPSNLKNIKLQSIQKLSNPFRALPRDNDIVIFKDIFYKHKNPQVLLRIAYTTLANTANLIIMEKKGTMDIEATKELLEKFEFRAPNAIDVMDEYDLVMAKKMHMWGNGL
jgi:predicted nicotinamide N-methyase